ncbi:hypothetical protein BKA58DRAFT_390350 [Alternaria rosae]|uniref:uncharacterized protein n=1 Tax=Alternaria rosae TaxID=1187941 RepID=UPI001E8D8DD5|nr:uncharacterized protein BKA58DRAFT_390350 [Alternaria rosae]KAH6865864.1 hypothetical protein BKA58DRAFT_390350 [Alternaria rosae]
MTDHSVYVVKCIEVSERILDASKSVATASVSTQTVLQGVQEASTADITRASGDHAIVLVLIDATSFQFLDELYRNKVSGGADTAKRLRAVVGERVAAILPAVVRSRYHIFIKICKAYCALRDQPPFYSQLCKMRHRLRHSSSLICRPRAQSRVLLRVAKYVSDFVRQPS